MAHGTDPLAGTAIVPRANLRDTVFGGDSNAHQSGMASARLPHTRLMRWLLPAALMNPLCWVALLIAPVSAVAATNTGDVRGTVFTVDSDGGRSVFMGAKVLLEGSSLS